MLEQLGEEYRSHMKRTGRVIPKLLAQSTEKISIGTP